MKLIKIYESVLRFAGFSSDDNGFISNVLAGQKQPAIVDGKQLVLPTQQNLRSFNPDNHIIFHPAVENILRGESVILVKLKQAINIRLNFTIGAIAQSLLNLIASPALHHKLNPDQLRIMMAVKDVDETTVNNYVKHVLLAGAQKNAESLFVHIYLKRGGFLNNRKHPRVGVTYFPFYHDLIEFSKDNKENKDHGYRIDKLRVKDRESLKQLFDFMIPDIEKEERYNAASDHKMCPYFDALLQTAALIASQLNDLLDLYEEFIEDAEQMKFDSEWIELFQSLEDLDKEFRAIPVQAGNEGQVERQEPNTVKEAVNTSFSRPAPVPVPAAPVAAPPELKQTKRGIDFQSLLAGTRPPMPAQQPVQYPPQHMQQPVQQMGYPPQFQQPMQQPVIDLNNVPMGHVIQTPNGPMIQTPGGLMPAQQQLMYQQPMQQPMMYQQPMMQQPMQMGYPQQFQQPMQQPMQQNFGQAYGGGTNFGAGYNRNV